MKQFEQVDIENEVIIGNILSMNIIHCTHLKRSQSHHNESINKIRFYQIQAWQRIQFWIYSSSAINFANNSKHKKCCKRTLIFLLMIAYFQNLFNSLLFSYAKCNILWLNLCILWSPYYVIKSVQITYLRFSRIKI